jgi:hypothetical protein
MIPTLLDTREETAPSRYYESPSTGQAFLKWLEDFIEIATFAANYIYGRKSERGS